MGMRLKTTHKKLRPTKREWSHMNPKVHIIVIGTLRWRVYVSRLKSWSWRHGKGAEGGLLRDRTMTWTQIVVIQKDRLTKVAINGQREGRMSLEIEIHYHQEEKGKNTKTPPWMP